MFWWQLYDVGNGHFGHQHQLSFYTGPQHSEDVTNIHKSSPPLTHQHHVVTNITVTNR